MSVKPWIAALFVILTACSEEKNLETGNDSGATERPSIHVANHPLHYFVEKIAAPWVEVRLPVPATEDPAFWKPSVEDVLAMQQADLVILNGASHESWLNNVSLSPSKLVVTTATFKDRLISMEEMETHSHGLEGEHAHSGTAFTTWLDLTLAVEQARSVKDALSARYPEQADQFELQFEELARELATLDNAIQELVAHNPDLPVVFSHPVYQYFQARYVINGRSVHWEPDAMPGDAMWKELINLTREHPAKFMIWEGEPLPRIAARLKAMGIESVVFDPCAKMPASMDFHDVMTRNIDTLRTVFQEQQ